MNVITTVGLAVIRHQHLLLVRKASTHKFILPGGKIDPGESDLECIKREIQEELLCDVDTQNLHFLGAFTDMAANEPETMVTTKLYRGSILGKIIPSREIEELFWFDLKSESVAHLADLVKNKVVPHLLGM